MTKHTLLASVLAFCLHNGMARATPISVGSGTNNASVVINFGDGAAYAFDIAFNTPTATGLGLFDSIEAETSLTTLRRDFGFGVFVDGITYAGHSDSGFSGGENFWHYWVRDSAVAPWVSASFGVADRITVDGNHDGWVYGSANAPFLVPEPHSLTLLLLGALLARRRSRPGG